MHRFDTIQRALILALGLLLIPVLVVAQPTIDGSISGDSEYFKLAEWTQGVTSDGNETGFGDHGMIELYGYQDGEYLYVAIVGEAENNGNAFLLFIDVSSQDGWAVETEIPPTTDNQSPFFGYGDEGGGAIHDFETDFGVRLSSTGSNTSPTAFTSIVDYRSVDNDGNAQETFLPGPNADNSFPADGSQVTFNTAPYDETEMAYDDTDVLTNVTSEAWEVKIPLSNLGAETGDTFRFFALYVAGDGRFLSDNTLPEIVDDTDGDNLGSPGSVDFTSFGGNQHTSPSTLPVELTSFDVAIDGPSAQLTWTTASETNNSGFAVQHAAPDRDFERVGWRAGAGTTSEAQRYTFKVDDLSPGTHRFRLKQVDGDGTASFSDVLKARVGLESQIVMTNLSSNPVQGQLRMQFGVKESQPVTVELYNVLGQRVRTLHQGPLAGGNLKTATTSVTGLSSGMYLVRLQAGATVKTQRIVVVQ